MKSILNYLSYFIKEQINSKQMITISYEFLFQQLL